MCDGVQQHYVKLYCCVCSKQITPNNTVNQYETKGPVTLMGPNEYCCSVCSEDLDENGLFPEERSDYFNMGVKNAVEK